MPSSPSPPLLDTILRSVARRYRLPAIPELTPASTPTPALVLAVTIEQARFTRARGETPDSGLARQFLEALAQMIRDAMRPEQGDAVFQAMVLRHRFSRVREYASLAAHAAQDRRRVRAAVGAIAHPAKLQRVKPGPRRELLAKLYAAADSGAWPLLRDTARRLALMGERASGASVASLMENPALANLLRLEVLTRDGAVQEYQKLWDRQGPAPASAEALAQGRASQRRGAAAEADAAQALEVLAQRLDTAQSRKAPRYRIVTSMRVPGALCASGERAKGEWDVVLLRRARRMGGAGVWDIELLVEVKASIDAATTDFPRLRRGLHRLAQADQGTVYPFASRQGEVSVSGVSLRQLPGQDGGLPACRAVPPLASKVLYCCDAPSEAAPRWLTAASRMQLLSAVASLEFASVLAEARRVKVEDLRPVWHLLLEAPRWLSVLHQYQTLREVRELMVHTDDLRAACAGAAP